MLETNDTALLRLALPKGRMERGVLDLLGEAGIRVQPTARGYRPAVSLGGVETKVLKPQNIVEMLDQGRRDVGFAGADWVHEMDATPIELLDTELDPVRLVAAAPEALLIEGALPQRRLAVTSEYTRLTQAWIERRGIEADLARSFGATEVFPPEDSDLIVDNSATGATLRANGLLIVDELMRSSTRLYASRQALDDPSRRQRIEDLQLLLRSVLAARQRVMIELNAPSDRLEAIVALLPSMREATVAELYGNSGYAVRAAIPRDRLPEIVPQVKSAGGTDIVVTQLNQIVP